VTTNPIETEKTTKRKVTDIRAAAPALVSDAIDLMDLTSRTADLFKVQSVPEQQRFLRLVLKSGSWEDGQLRAEFEEPFESLRRSNQLSKTKQMQIPSPQPGFEDWLNSPLTSQRSDG